MPKVTPKSLPSMPTKVATDLEALDYLILPDDNAGRIDTVTDEGEQVTVTLTNLATGQNLTATFERDAIVSFLPG